MNKTLVSLNVLGAISLAYGIFAIIQAIVSGNPGWIFWACYIGLILIGIGSLTKNYLLIKSQLNILTIPLVMWVLDFILIFAFDIHFFGMTDYFFNQITLFARLVSLEHFFLLPLGYTSLYLTKSLTKNPLENAFIFSLIELVFLFGLTKILTLPKDNVNAVFTSRINFIPNTEFYLFYLFVIGIIMIFITDFTISKIFKKM